MASGSFQLINDMLFNFYPDISIAILWKSFMAILIATWMVWLWSRRRFYMLSLKMPGPISLPIIGNAIELGAFGKGHEIVDRIVKMGERFKSPYCGWHGLDFAIIISDPEDLEEVLLSKSTSYKDKLYDVMKPSIGAGILTNSGALWKKHRQIINPAFRMPSVRSHEQLYNKHARRFVKTLSSLCGDEVNDVLIYAKRCAGDILIETLLSEEVDFYKGDKDEYLTLSSRLLELNHERLLKFWQHPDLIYKMSKHCKVRDEYLNQYRSFYHKLLNDKISKYNDEKMADKKPKPAENGYKPVKNTFEVLADAALNGHLTHDEVIGEFDNIFAAGIDSTSGQMSLFMMILGMHKEAQNKVWKEVKDFYGTNLDCDVESEHLSRLPYLEMCIKEFIRLFPSGPILRRIVSEDFYLKTKNIDIPAGTIIVLLYYQLHRDPRYWDSPNSFIPERFSPENSKKRPHFSYLPFSAGQRNCVAQHFAMNVLKTIGVHLIRNYEFQSDWTMDDIIYKSDILVRSARGYKVALKKRNRDL